MNSVLLTVDMTTWRVTGSANVGVEPDVVAFDGHADRVYVASESGWVTVFQRDGTRVRFVDSQLLGGDAHSVAVDPLPGEVTSRCSRLQVAILPCWCASSPEWLGVAAQRRFYRVIDTDMAGLDDFAPDAEGDVVLAAEPGQRVQDACVSHA